MKLVFIHGWGLDATLWNEVSALLPEFEQERIDLGFYSTPEQWCPPPLAGGVRGGLVEQEDPSPAKTKDLAEAKSKFSLPLPQGERNQILVGHSLGFVHGLNKHQNWKSWVAINSFPRFVKTSELPGCTSAAELRDIRLRLTKAPQKTLKDFHAFINAYPPQTAPNAEQLRIGLDELHDLDVGATAVQISPGLVLASLQDPLVPAATSVALAANKELVWHDSNSHTLPQSDPAFCAYAIRSFLVQNDLNRI